MVDCGAQGLFNPLANEAVVQIWDDVNSGCPASPGPDDAIYAPAQACIKPDLFTSGNLHTTCTGYDPSSSWTVKYFTVGVCTSSGTNPATASATGVGMACTQLSQFGFVSIAIIVDCAGAVVPLLQPSTTAATVEIWEAGNNCGQAYTTAISVLPNTCAPPPGWYGSIKVTCLAPDANSAWEVDYFYPGVCSSPLAFSQQSVQGTDDTTCYNLGDKDIKVDCTGTRPAPGMYAQDSSSGTAAVTIWGTASTNCPTDAGTSGDRSTLLAPAGSCLEPIGWNGNIGVICATDQPDSAWTVEYYLVGTCSFAVAEVSGNGNTDCVTLEPYGGLLLSVDISVDCSGTIPPNPGSGNTVRRFSGVARQAAAGSVGVLLMLAAIVVMFA